MPKPVAIPMVFNSNTKTAPISLEGMQVVGLVTPAVLASTSLTFNMQPTMNTANNVLVPVKAATGGSALTFTVTTNSYYGFTADLIAQFTGIGHIQCVGGSTEVAGTVIYAMCIPHRQS